MKQYVLLCALSVILAILATFKYVAGIGISSHIEIATRGREFFEDVSQGVDYNQILKQHDDAFQSGAPYPDAFYPGLCFDGVYHQVSEDTHWTPFINATVNYIRRVYPKPWNTATEKLVAFLLAVVSHQVADVNWHSLGIDQGFLTTMGMINYHGSYPAAHSDGDFGGDVLNIFGLDLDYIGKLRHWYVPTEDLYNIYYDLYGEERMTTEVIENCTALLFLGRLGENIGVVDKLYPLYARRSTFLTDTLQDYYLGGMDDMAVWSTNVWRHTITMLNSGTDVCDIPYNPIYISCNALKHYRNRYNVYKRLRRSIHHEDEADIINNIDDELLRYNFDENDVFDKINKRNKYRGVYLSPSKKLRKSLKWKRRRYQKMRQYYEKIDQFNLNVTAPEYFYTATHDYSRFGETLNSGDFNGDGHMDLVVGAPSYSDPSNLDQGRVYVIYGSSEGLPRISQNIENAANLTLSGPELNGRFGSAMCTSDLNADGLDDLVISAPSVGSETLEYQGSVHVFFGSNSGLANTSSIRIYCQQRYCNLGWSLAGPDLNTDGSSDLVIGSPFAPAGGEQRGFVGVLFANASYTGKVTELIENDLDWVGSGTQNYEWFGYSVTGGIVNNNNWVVVGAPAYRVCASPDCSFQDADIQAAGRVYGFDMSTSPSNYSFVIDGTVEFAQLGFHVQLQMVNNEEKLFVTAATEDVPDAYDEEYTNVTQGGFVHMYDWNQLTKALSTPKQNDWSNIFKAMFMPNLVENFESTKLEVSPVISFYGDRPFARFGSSFVVADFDNNGEEDIIINAPLRSESFFSQVESGRSFVFNDINNIWDNRVAASQANAVLGVVGDKLRFSYSSTLITTGQGSYMVFGMPHSNKGARLAGQIAVYRIA